MVKDLYEWIKSIKFKYVLLLSGADASRGNDKLLERFILFFFIYYYFFLFIIIFFILFY